MFFYFIFSCADLKQLLVPLLVLINSIPIKWLYPYPVTPESSKLWLIITFRWLYIKRNGSLNCKVAFHMLGDWLSHSLRTLGVLVDSWLPVDWQQCLNCVPLPNNIPTNLLCTPTITCWLGIQSAVNSAIEQSSAFPQGLSSAYFDVRYIHAPKWFIRF